MINSIQIGSDDGMNPKSMKHSASIWDGEIGTSHCIDVVHWEGDITPEQLAHVANQISKDWQTIDMQLDTAHPMHGNVYHLRRITDDEYEEAEYKKRKAAFEERYAGQRVWVHGFHYNEDVAAGTYQPFYYDVMFSTLFVTIDDIESLCNKHYGDGVWDEYSLYLDDRLPKPLAIDF
jgi:hypothetical protein